MNHILKSYLIKDLIKIIGQYNLPRYSITNKIKVLVDVDSSAIVRENPIMYGLYTIKYLTNRINNRRIECYEIWESCDQQKTDIFLKMNNKLSLLL
jgi:hypothetical protein